MYKAIIEELKLSNTQLVAVSKTKPNEQILEIYNQGHRVFGENRVQELTRKSTELPSDIEWHMIGHLQSNKVKYIAPFVDMIESVDTLKLLKEINKQSLKNNRTIKCLLQFKIAEEATKSGLTIKEAAQFLESPEFQKMKNIQLCGVMGMATFTDNLDQVRREFKALRKIFEQLKSNFFSTDSAFKEISMGMSGDYKIAVDEGSTMVRIGSLIFGSRNY